jgi:hypothetical protein
VLAIDPFLAATQSSLGPHVAELLDLRIIGHLAPPRD